MKRLMRATVAGAALLAGATAANAQYYYDYGYYGPRGPFVERGVGLQLGPVGIGIYDNSPAYYDGYAYYHRQPRDNSVYESNSFRAHQWWPQSPPGGGY